MELGTTDKNKVFWERELVTEKTNLHYCVKKVQFIPVVFRERGMYAHLL